MGGPRLRRPGAHRRADGSAAGRRGLRAGAGLARRAARAGPSSRKRAARAGGGADAAARRGAARRRAGWSGIGKVEADAPAAPGGTDYVNVTFAGFAGRQDEWPGTAMSA